MNKREKLRATNPLGGLNASTTPSPADVADIMFGKTSGGDLNQVDGARRVAEAIRIDEIVADPVQPRRTVPSEVRDAAHWVGDPRNVRDLFDTWVALVGKERRSSFDLRLYVEIERERRSPEIPPNLGALEISLLKLAELAASIRQDGLLNPITVARDAGVWRLETGERRWLAYHMLYYLFGDSKYTRIPAQRVEQIDVWRQASENNARADLNGISRSRQYAILMMALYTEAGQSFSPYTTFEHEQDYYKQAADLDMPYGKSSLVLNAMGLTHRAAFSRYRKLLRGPRYVWQAGDDGNFPINDLVKLCDMPELEAKLAITRLLHGSTLEPPYDMKKELRTMRPYDPEGLMPAPKDRLIGADEPPEIEALMASDDQLEPGSVKHFNLLLQYINRSGQGRPRESLMARQLIEEMRTWLDGQERRIRSYRHT